jgi:hypothetical protein
VASLTLGEALSEAAESLRPSPALALSTRFDSA